MAHTFESIMANEARHLTEEEMDYICESIPRFPSLSKTCSKHMRNETIKKHKNLLREMKVPPFAIEELKNITHKRYLRALAAPGESVGNISACSTSAEVTQRKLSAYHNIGIEEKDFLVEILDTFNRKKDRNPEEMIIHAKDWNMSKSETVDFLKTLEGITMMDLLHPTLAESSFSLGNGTSSERLAILKRKAPWLELRMQFMGRNNALNIFLESDVEKLTVYRLKFNLVQLYSYSVLLSDIVTFLEGLSGVKCISSPTFTEAVIDVFIDHSFIHSLISDEIGENSLLPHDSVNIFYNNTVRKLFTESLYKNRIKGLRSGKIEVSDVLTVFSGRERKLEDGTYRVYGNATETRIGGIRKEKLHNLFTKCNVQVHSMVYEPGEVSLHLSMESGESPLEHTEKLVKSAKKAYEEHILETNRQKKYDTSLDFEEGELYRAATYVNINANYNDLRRILAHPKVDRRFSILKNPYRVMSVLGIEAARMLCIREPLRAIRNRGGNVSTRNIAINVDPMCCLGVIIPTTSSGTLRIPQETINNITNETPFVHIQSAGVLGIKEKVQSTPSKVILGQICSNGTGSVRAKPNPRIPLRTFDSTDTAKYKPDVNITFDLNKINIVDGSGGFIVPELSDKDEYQALSTMNIDAPNVQSGAALYAQYANANEEEQTDEQLTDLIEGINFDEEFSDLWM